jgi:hypothetical protein
MSMWAVGALMTHAHELSPLRTRSGDAAAGGAARLAARGALGPLHQRHGRRAGPQGVLCTLRGRRLAQPAVPSGDDGQGGGLRLRHGRVQLAQDRAAAARGPGVADAGRRQLPAPPHDLRLPRLSSEGAVRVVRAGGQARPGDGPGQVGHGGHRRHQGQGQRQPPQGHELRAHEPGRGRTQGADRRVAGARQGHRRGRGQRAGVGPARRDRTARGEACGHPRSP